MSANEEQEHGEPARLRRGKLFHKKIQGSWQEAEGEVTAERSVVKPSGRSGRIDIFVVSGEGMMAIPDGRELSITLNLLRYHAVLFSTDRRFPESTHTAR